MSKRKYKIIEILNGDIIVARNSEQDPETITIINNDIDFPFDLFYYNTSIFQN